MNIIKIRLSLFWHLIERKIHKMTPEFRNWKYFLRFFLFFINWPSRCCRCWLNSVIFHWEKNFLFHYESFSLFTFFNPFINETSGFQNGNITMATNHQPISSRNYRQIGIYRSIVRFCILFSETFLVNFSLWLMGSTFGILCFSIFFKRPRMCIKICF